MTMKDRTAFPVRHLLPLMTGRVPGQLVVQFTDECNASCPQCGMRRTRPFKRFTLGMSDCLKIIEAAAKAGFASISFTGGEPFLHFAQIAAAIRYARDLGIPYTRTGTNGFFFMGSDSSEFVDRVAKIAGKLSGSGIYTFWISVDSFNPDLHEKMRGLPGVIQGIRRALPIFHKHGIYPSANLGINKAIADLKGIPPKDGEAYYGAFREGFRQFYEFVISLGFTMANACYPMNISEGNGGDLQAVYGANATAGPLSFTTVERIQIYRALMDTIPEYRSRIRIFSPRCSLYSLIRDHEKGLCESYPCRGGLDFFFIDARGGDTFPCGFRGAENLGKLWNLDLKKKSAAKECRACDWECFRDPSEMAGPLLGLFPFPAGFWRKARTDREFMKLWLDDWKYYRACGLFSCRTPPDYSRLRAYAATTPPVG